MHDPDSNPAFGGPPQMYASPPQEPYDYEGTRAQVQRSIDGQWYVRVVAANGEIVFRGETIRNRKDAIKTARKYAPYAELEVQGGETDE